MKIMGRALGIELDEESKWAGTTMFLLRLFLTGERGIMVHLSHQVLQKFSAVGYSVSSVVINLDTG